MNREITISAMWRTLKRSFIIILAVVILAMAGAALVTKFAIDEKFSSTATFYVINVSIDEEYVTNSLIAANENLAKAYIKIIQSDKCVDGIVKLLKDKYNLTYTNAQIISMMSTTIDGESSTFSVKITDTDNEVAFIIARYIAIEAPDIIREFVTPNIVGEDNNKFNIERAKLLDAPVLDTVADSPNLLKNMALTGIATAVVVYLICLVVALCNSVIKNENDLKSVIPEKYNVIGIVPKSSNK